MEPQNTFVIKTEKLRLELQSFQMIVTSYAHDH